MPTTLTVDALAAARLTRLVTRDVITSRIRGAVIVESYTWSRGSYPPPTLRHLGSSEPEDYVEVDPDPPGLAYLVTCPWCAGFYVTLAVLAARRFAPRLWSPIATALAVSFVAGIGAGHE